MCVSSDRSYLRKRQLTRPCQWLLEHGQQINHGSIKFYVRGGEPDLGRPHSRVRTLKLSGGVNGPRPESESDDFELRREHIALIEQLKNLPDSTCVRVKFAHGIPGSSIDIIEEQQAA